MRRITVFVEFGAGSQFLSRCCRTCQGLHSSEPFWVTPRTAFGQAARRRGAAAPCLREPRGAEPPSPLPAAVLYFLLQVSFLVDEGVSPVLLQLLSCALCGSKVLAALAASAGSSSTSSSSAPAAASSGQATAQPKSSTKKSKKEEKEKEKEGKGHLLGDEGDVFSSLWEHTVYPLPLKGFSPSSIET